jgi:hypothetical protein
MYGEVIVLKSVTKLRKCETTATNSKDIHVKIKRRLNSVQFGTLRLSASYSKT